MDPEQDVDEQKTYQTIQSSGALPPAEDAKRASGFLCGECGAENHLSAKDPVRCSQCGYRIMYKKRARRRTFNFSSSFSIILSCPCLICYFSLLLIHS